MNKIKKIICFISSHKWLELLIKISFCLVFVVVGLILGTIISYLYYIFAIVGVVSLMFVVGRKNWKKYKENNSVASLIKRKIAERKDIKKNDDF